MRSARDHPDQVDSHAEAVTTRAIGIRLVDERSGGRPKPTFSFTPGQSERSSDRLKKVAFVKWFEQRRDRMRFLDETPGRNIAAAGDQNRRQAATECGQRTTQFPSIHFAKILRQ
jgi:hypothetical protein